MKDLVSDGFAQVVKPYIDTQDKTTREILAPVEADETDASRAYQIGDQLILGGILYDVIAPIAQHGIITSTGSGANIEEADNITDQIDAVNNALTNKVNTSDIANNLTTTASGKVLDARQGKVLNDNVTNQKIIVATKTLVAGSAEQSFEVTGLTDDHVLLRYELGTPSNVVSDISWNTNTTGYIKLTATILTGGTTITMYFGLKK